MTTILLKSNPLKGLIKKNDDQYCLEVVFHDMIPDDKYLLNDFSGIPVEIIGNQVYFRDSKYKQYSVPVNRNYKEELALVTKVIDGDTIRVEMEDGRDESVRYLITGATERGQNYYDKAREYNASLVDGDLVTMRRDVTNRDKYGRLLRYIWNSNNDFVNLVLIRNGMACVYPFMPDIQYLDEFRRAQKKAMTDCLGIWECLKK